MLDLVKSQLEHTTVDLSLWCSQPRGVRTRGGRVRGRCDKGGRAPFLPRGMLELGARIRGHPLVTSHIRAFDTFLSSMKHHQVLCLVCMSFKAYLVREPFETRNPYLPT